MTREIVRLTRPGGSATGLIRILQRELIKTATRGLDSFHHLPMLTQQSLSAASSNESGEE